jgi:hypothetical protein
MQLRRVSDATNSEGFLTNAKKVANLSAFCYQNPLEHVSDAASNRF